ncbi:ABC transporter ATP-binding protein [Rhodococcus sp. NPDC056743]|uniref:ABC transporter ATP-binding protein n=1 Tax=Rhodococcus sp. NPDC056743 TaxID=3345934 RepID=UPI00366F86E9
MTILDDISLDVQRGELLVLLGPSGCGKTTLLRCLVGLERPDSGRIALGDSTVMDASDRVFVPPNKRDVGMVFQNYALWPHMKIADNVAYPLKSRKMRRELASGRVKEVLDVVQCSHLADRYPPQLSGGQQQRVSLARALAVRPALMLLDEPLSNLDALLRIDLRTQMRMLHRQLKFTAVYVTHDQEEAMALGTRVAVMKAGKFEQIGTPDEVYRYPATEYVADFLGARNTFDISVSDGLVDIADTKFVGVAAADVSGTHTLRFRDGDLAVRGAGENIAQDDQTLWIPNAILEEVLPSGEFVEHVVRIDDRRIYIKVLAKQSNLRPGQLVDVGFDPSGSLCYDSDGRLVRHWTSL